MNERKKANVLLIFFLIIAIVIIIVMGYFIYKLYNEKLPTNEPVNNAVNTLENILPDEENNIPNSDVSSTTNYVYTSADNMAAQGNPGVLEIFKLNDTQIDFEYNHGWDFVKSAIDRKVSGKALLNEQGFYEFSENVDGHKYTLILDIKEDMVTLYEYDDGELLSQINLWS